LAQTACGSLFWVVRLPVLKPDAFLRVCEECPSNVYKLSFAKTQSVAVSRDIAKYSQVQRRFSDSRSGQQHILTGILLQTLAKKYPTV